MEVVVDCRGLAVPRLVLCDGTASGVRCCPAGGSYDAVTSTMSFLPSGQIFRELQVVHETGYFSAITSLEDHWQEVSLHHRMQFAYFSSRYSGPFLKSF